MGMAWQWRFEDAQGKAKTLQVVATALEALDPPAKDEAEAARTGFETQGDAETWIGLSWRRLLDAGVVQVVLLQDDREIYGPMSLIPKSPPAPARHAPGSGLQLEGDGERQETAP